MEEQFVPYELSVKLKELGFDEECFGYYGKEKDKYDAKLEILYDTKHNSSQWRTIQNVFRSQRNAESFSESYYTKKYYCLAPLWQQAFDWFRTKGFDMWVSRSFNCFNVNIVEYNVEEDCSDDVTDGLVFRDFIGYEEARLACLEKLIELCQKQ